MNSKEENAKIGMAAHKEKRAELKNSQPEFSAELVAIYQSLRSTDLSNLKGDGHTLYWLTLAEAITTALSLLRTLTYITDRDLQKHTQASKGWRDMAMRHAVRMGLLEKTERGWKSPK